MRGKDWPNLERMFAALCLLVISPLLGIPVGAVFWGSLERGLLVFNLLGLGGFTLVTKPFWRGDSKRIQGLLRSAAALGISALLDILSGRPIPFAVYFSSMVECFSLIPWITEILNEIHRGQWRERPTPSPSAHVGPVGRETPSPREKPVYQDPEEPISGFPRWGFPLLALFLGLILLLILTSCHSPAEVAPSPSPSPVPTPSAVIPTPSESPETDRTLPALFAENERWMVYLDDWAETEADGSVMDLSVYEKDETLYQKLRSCSDYTPPHPWWHLDNEGIDPPVLLTDLNFDGIDDIRVDYETRRCGAYAAFLWDEEEGRFVEEPTFAEIKRPYLMDGMIFGNCSSGAAFANYYAYSYSQDEGYQLLRSLHIDFSDEDQIIYTECLYKDGKLIDTLETKENLRQNDFWKNYMDPTGGYLWQ